MPTETRPMYKIEPKDGGPAFGEFQQAGNCSIKNGGMSLRDYFAAKAMQGFAASPSMIDSNDSRAVTYVAAASYAMADAMLAECAK